jgi:DNA processing protein
LDDAPSVLFVWGDVGCLRLPQLAIVGSRNPTPAGRETAESFAAHLARTGLTVTSGLALGVDAAGHRGALKAGGKTIAVCGTGLDIIYPREHESLAQQIALNGALVSEFAPGVQATRFNFPRRNRLISGLSLGTLVVEAALRSGSLITARLAAEQGREIFAIPGSIHNALSKGCHQLIRQGAQLVETAQDIFDELAPLAATLLDTPLPALIRQNTDRAEVFSTPLDKDYKILLDAVGFEPAGVDLVIHRTGFKADEVASMLLILELQGLIESYPGGLYIRARPEAVK